MADRLAVEAGLRLLDLGERVVGVLGGIGGEGADRLELADGREPAGDRRARLGPARRRSPRRSGSSRAQKGAAARRTGCSAAPGGRPAWPAWRPASRRARRRSRAPREAGSSAGHWNGSRSSRSSKLGEEHEVVRPPLKRVDHADLTREPCQRPKHDLEEDRPRETASIPTSVNAQPTSASKAGGASTTAMIEGYRAVKTGGCRPQLASRSGSIPSRTSAPISSRSSRRSSRGRSSVDGRLPVADRRRDRRARAARRRASPRRPGSCAVQSRSKTEPVPKRSRSAA